MPPRRPRRPIGHRPLGPRRRPPASPRGRQLNPRLQRELRRANHLMSIGDHANAAEIFKQLAQHARDRGIAGPGAMLLMRAAHAYLLSGRVQDADTQLEQALKAFETAGQLPAAMREGQRYADLLEAEGYSEEAETLRETLAQRFSGSPTSNELEEDQGTFPEKCPYCGASMSLEQISSRGARAAECHYCGSVVLPRKAD